MYGGKEEAFAGKLMNAEFVDDSWTVDSGATDHTAHRRECFYTFKQFEMPLQIKIGNKSTITVLGKGVINE